MMEIYLKSLEMQDYLVRNLKIRIDSLLGRDKGILEARRGKMVMKERSSFDFLTYYNHFQGLPKEEKEFLETKFESQHK